MTPARLACSILRAPFTGRTWSGALYIVVGLPFAALATVVAAPLVVGAPLTVTLVGLPIVALTLLGARRLADIQRDLARFLIREVVEGALPVERPRGFTGWLDATIRDAAAWRAVGYFALKLPLAMVGSYAVLGTLVLGLADVIAGLLSLRGGRGANVRAHHHPVILGFGLASGGGEPTYLLAVLGIGLGLLLVAPWVVRAFVEIDRALVRRLLGAQSLSARLRSLEHSRAHAVDESAAQLRRIERDLHDGAQARLSALAMTLGQIQDDLNTRPGTANEETRALVDAAHRNAKATLVELRNLARGIHPAALDDGLDPALRTLAATAMVPVTMTVDIPERPSPAIETITYFCVAELLANMTKHSAANHGSISATESVSKLLVTVSDDGVGGATMARGGGLAGLAERVRTVDGHLEVSSPRGGPTVVRVSLPLHS